MVYASFFKEHIYQTIGGCTGREQSSCAGWGGDDDAAV